MENEKLAQMMGLKSESTVSQMKLNEVSCNGDTGKYKYIDLVGGKQEDGKYKTEELGDAIDGVMIKMRWRFFKYEEDAKGNAVITNSTEYDDKNTDEVLVYGVNERGLAKDMKDKHKLSTQRVIYTYLPSKKEVVRLIVKASAFNDDQNPNDELGLFNYQNTLESMQALPLDYITKFIVAYRENIEKPKKSYYAMAFAQGTLLTDEQRQKMVDKLVEIDSQTSKVKKIQLDEQSVEQSVPQEDESQEVKASDNYPVEEEVNPEDIPF